MKNIKNISLGLLLCTTGLFAQSIEREVVASAGETISNGAVSLDFTVGELAVSDISNGDVVLQQGFHQTRRLYLKLSPLVFLEGPAMSAGGAVTMGDDLRQQGLIPVTSPFPDGKQTIPEVFNTTGSNAIVDWIYISLMDKNDRSIELASTSAFLQVDGDVVGADGTSSLKFDIDIDDYFVRVLHRNHLAILTATPVTITRDVSILDLTADPLEVFGGVNALSDVGGAFAMVSGDAVANGQIQFNDRDAIADELGTSGYKNEDADLNGQVQFVDINLYTNPNLGRAIQF
ncbi:hypothetical protein [Patiriisocius sp. Uisw_047]|jgi:hypothetical protein|uniref:hypothetical protein n=1 Tax=Patiriisocius sp. Uisw_047 TaxID=3230969 RepID=UPI0039E8DCF2